MIYLQTGMRDRTELQNLPSPDTICTIQNHPQKTPDSVLQFPSAWLLPNFQREDLRYLHNIFFFHPGWESEAPAEDLKQHRPQGVVVVSPDLSNTFNTPPPKQLLVSLLAPGEKAVLNSTGQETKVGNRNRTSMGYGCHHVQFSSDFCVYRVHVMLFSW